jgi:hypothetical protein
VKLKVGSAGPASYYSSDNSAEHCCTFKSTNHGWTGQQIKVEFASIGEGDLVNNVVFHQRLLEFFSIKSVLVHTGKFAPACLSSIPG